MDELRKYDFRIDIRGLIKLLAKNLYSEEDVFVREMLQNAHDSIQRRRIEESEKASGRTIRVRLFPFDHKIAFEDDGRGMTESEIHDYLATIGRSGTDEFRQRLIQLGRKAEASLIGQFGIGLLSAFVVAEEVEVVTRSSVEGQPAWCWVSQGDKNYTLSQTDYDRIGSTVTITVAKGRGEAFLDEDVMRKTIRKYADFLPVPIYLNDESVLTNTITPPWTKTFDSDSQRHIEYFTFVDKRYQDSILHVIPIHADNPYKVDGILYVTDRRSLDFKTTGAIDIYQSGMFVQERNHGLLPGWASFIGGILDSPDLTLTAARDRLVHDSAFEGIQTVLGNLIITELIQLKTEDPDKLERLLRWHQLAVKAMCIEHDDLFNAIADLIPFETNRGPKTLDAYLQHPQVTNTDAEGRRRIFYFTEAGSATQFYMLCDEKGLLVVDASLALDEKFLEKYAKRCPKVKLHQINIAGSEFIFTPLEAEERPRYRPLESELGRIIGDPRSSVQIVRFRPTTLPAVTMLSPEARLRDDLQEAKNNIRLPDSIRRLVGRMYDQNMSFPVTLYVNADNQIIQRLAGLDVQSPVATACLRAVLSNAILLASRTLIKEQMEMMFRDFSNVVDLLLSQAADLEQTRTQLSSVQLAMQDMKKVKTTFEMTAHASCFFAMPFKPEYDHVFKALRQVLEDRPFYWQVIRADEKQFERTISGNVHEHIARAHCYFVDVSENNFNVGLELGWMQSFPDRPIILLRRDDSQDVPADIRGAIYVAYPPTNKLNIGELGDFLRRELGRIEALKKIQGSTHYLSPLLLSQSGIDPLLAEAISNWFSSLEAFLAAAPASIAEKLNRGQDIVESVQKFVQKSYGPILKDQGSLHG
jgi:molecular chaperone HtpG